MNATAQSVFSPSSVREMPHSDEAELAVLGSVILRNPSMDIIVDIITHEDFYRPAHSRIFKAMEQLYNRNDPIDPLTLRLQLESESALEEVGGDQMLFRLGDMVPTSAHVEHYARIVSNRSALREMIKASYEVLDIAYGTEESLEEAINKAEKAIFDATKRHVKTDLYSLEDVINDALQVLDKQIKAQGQITGVPSGFPDLDRLTNGFQKSDLIILAARPSMGKTSLALNIAEHAALYHNKNVLFISLEMSRILLGIRMLTALARVDQDRLRQGDPTPEDWARLIRAAQQLSETNIFLDDSGAISVPEMRLKARRLAAQRGIDLIIVDYIQLIKATLESQRSQTREQIIGDISRGLKMLAKEFDVPVLAISQLNRFLERRDDKRPRLADLRESGALEQDADVILFLYRESFYNPEVESKDLTELIIGKQRNGPTDTVKLVFKKNYTRFESHDPSHDDKYF